MVKVNLSNRPQYLPRSILATPMFPFTLCLNSLRPHSRFLSSSERWTIRPLFSWSSNKNFSLLISSFSCLHYRFSSQTRFIASHLLIPTPRSYVDFRNFLPQTVGATCNVLIWAPRVTEILSNWNIWRGPSNSHLLVSLLHTKSNKLILYSVYYRNDLN